MYTADSAASIAAGKVDALASAIHVIKSHLEMNRVAKGVDLEASIKKLERSFWHLDGPVQSAFESHIWLFRPQVLAQLVSLVFSKHVSAKVTQYGTLQLRWEGGTAEIRRNDTRGYAAFVPYTAYTGGTVRKVLLSSSLINMISQVIDFVKKCENQPFVQ